jgi:hypothetical protein
MNIYNDVYGDKFLRYQSLQSNNYVTLLEVICLPILGRVFCVTMRDVELNTSKLR